MYIGDLSSGVLDCTESEFDLTKRKRSHNRLARSQTLTCRSYYILMPPPHVQRFVTLLSIEMHSVFKNWIESIEIQCSLMLSLDPFSI